MSTITPTTSSTRPIGVQGRIAFETDTKNIIVYDGTNWRGYVSDGAFTSYATNTKALDFDGSADYVSVANSTSVSLTNNFSITCWVEFDSLSGAPMMISKRESISGHAYQFYSTGSKLAFNNGGGINYSTTTLSTGTWYHIGMTFASGVVTFYLDGSSDGGFTSTNTVNPTNTYELQFGRAFNGNYLNGRLDEIAFFDTVLTSSQISNIYSNKLYPEMVSFWRFEDDVTDSVGSNDGTNNGATFTTDKPY